ncbi:MAG: DinB family protein, partial [Thermoanaerobaculia bacterium]
MMNSVALTQFEVAKMVLQMNLEGVTHEESLISPASGGNCLNWVVGHLVSAYNKLLPGIGGESVWDAERQALYDRGSDPILAERAVPFDLLMADFAAAHGRVVERVAALTANELAAPAPYSPVNNPDETLGSLINLLAFHQSYHTGQTGLLRRV